MSFVHMYMYLFVNKFVWKSNAFAVNSPQTPSRLKSSDTNRNLAGVDSQWDFTYANSLLTQREVTHAS